MTYQTFIVISALLSLTLSIYLLKKRKVKSAFIFSILMLFITIFIVGSFFELIVSNISIKILWRNICQIGYLLAILTLLIFVIDNIGKESFLKPINIALIYSFPILGLILSWTDQYHHLMRKHIFIVKEQLIVVSTPFASVIMFFEITIVIIVVLLLIDFYNKAHIHYRKQIIGMIIGIIILLILEILKVFRPDMILVLPPTAVTFSLTGFISFWSIFHYQLFSIVPVAQDMVLDSIQEGIIIVDDLGIIIVKNIAIDRFIMDITEQDVNIKGNNVEFLLSEWPRWSLSCKRMQVDEFEIDTTDWGKKRYYYVKVYPICDKHQKKLGSVSILHDITERKIRENELVYTAEWSKEHLKDLAGELSIQKKQCESIIENMSDHCMVFNKEGKYIIINKAAKEVISFFQVEQVGDWLKGVRYYDIHGNEINTDALPAVKVLNGEKLNNFRLIIKQNKDELHFNINGVPVYDDNGEFLFGVICSTDITEIIQHEQEITLQNEQLANIINNISDIAILSITDKEGNYIYYNNAVKNYFSENAFKVKIGTTYQKGVYFNDDGSEINLYDMPVSRVLRGETIKNFHFIMKNFEKEIHFLINAAPVIDKNGNLTYGVFFNMDITEQILHKKLIPVAEQLVAQNAFKDKLLTVFTHDIRNPMANMVSLIELLEEDEEYYSGDNREIFRAVKEQFNNTYNIVDNLLEWLRSQKEGLVYEPLVLDLSKIISEMIKIHYTSAGSKNIKISSEIVVGMSVFADKDMLEIVLRNILSNALKFTANGGIIFIKAYESGNKTIIAISDTGKGMDSEKVKTLFSESYASSTIGTAGEKGIGLGLLICKEFVIRNGGEIWVDSMPEIGSTFCFSLSSANKNI